MHAAPATALETLYGADRIVGADNLITIDTATGTGTIVGSLGFSSVTGLTYDPATGDLYGFGADNGPSQLITIDPDTGAATAVGPIGAPNASGLSFGAGGILYAVDLSLDVLLTINTSTGAATIVGSLGFSAVSSLAYDASSGILYGVDYIQDQLIAINTTTGAGTPVGTAPGTAGPGNITGLAFSSDGTLYAIDIISQLLTIDTTTGTATAIGPVGFDVSGGLAFSTDDVVLEPVEIDVKPGGETNCGGVIPVAIFGSDTLDVIQIDQTTLSFEGEGVRVRGNGLLSCGLRDANSDGYDDLVCRYDDSTTEGTLTGELLDGTPIEGADTFCLGN